jgi:glycosyltransferase involved in cell wall biosynthesis
MAITISVIIPTHDRGESLRRTVESVLAQRTAAAELIVVHDGPGRVDDALAGLAEGANVPFCVISRQPPSLPAGRNAGLRGACGEVVLFLEDDITIPPDYLTTLADLYQADADRQVAGIGSNVMEPHLQTPIGRLWRVLATICCQVKWKPRRCLARYVSLPRALRGRLQPAVRVSGGGLSLRSSAAKDFAFDETFPGHALGEDREFTFRFAASRALFYAPRLKLTHHCAGGGRGEMLRRGQCYVEHWIYIVRSATEGGAGTWMLLGWDFAGTMLMYLLVAAVGGNRRGNAAFAAGMAGELLRLGVASLRRWLCG